MSLLFLTKKDNTSSISIVTKNPSLLRMLVISIMSAINLPLSPINLFSTYAVCCGTTKLN